MTQPKNFVEVTTPVVRLVQGNPFSESTKDAEGRPLLTKDGSPRKEYFIAVAIRKDDPEWPAIHNKMIAVAAAAWPDAHKSPSFSWKLTDGDSTVPNLKGKRPCDQEGFPGHWILKMRTGIPIRVSKDRGTVQIIDRNQVKCGDYFRVHFLIRANTSQSKPGIYLNPDMMDFDREGAAIVSGPDSAAVFGGTAQAQVPAATAAPAPMPVAPPPSAVTTPPPAREFLTPPAERRRVYNGSSYPESHLRQSGWTDAQINQLPLDVA